MRHLTYEHSLDAMTRLLLTLLVSFGPLFSSPVLAEQLMAKLYYSNQLESLEEAATWLVNSNNPICTGSLNEANAAKFHRQSLTWTLEKAMDGAFHGVTREDYAAEMGRQIGNTFTNDYMVLCSPFTPDDWLGFLIEE